MYTHPHRNVSYEVVYAIAITCNDSHSSVALTFAFIVNIICLVIAHSFLVAFRLVVGALLEVGYNYHDGVIGPTYSFSSHLDLTCSDSWRSAQSAHLTGFLSGANESE